MIISLLLAALPLAAEPLSIGFVNHYPMIARQDADMARTGANVAIVRAPWALIEPRQGEFDFHWLDDQLQLAQASGIKLVVLLEAGPCHAANVPWLREELTAANECMASASGTQVSDPSFFSSRYREHLERYISRVVGYLSSHPLADRVLGYNNGCEWWYPLSNSYGAPDRRAFREAMQYRYGSLEALNDTWGTSFTSWEQVQPPDLVMSGSATAVQGSLVPPSANADISVCDTSSPRLAVTPGRAYRFSADVSLPREGPAPVNLEIAWFGPAKPQPLAIVSSPRAFDPGEHHLTLEATPPEGADSAWLHLKVVGPGEATVHHFSFLDDQGTELAANTGLDPAAGGWQFVPWTAPQPDRLTTSWEATGQASVRYHPDVSLDSGARWPLAEVSDWVRFRADSQSEFLQWFAARIRQADLTRPVITYLTFAFANPFEWDYTQQMAIEANRVAALGDNIAVLGMQLSSTRGDNDSVTCALDIVRTSGKPMWAIDLLDFSLGTSLGEEGIERLSRSVLQHGGTGIQFYCWWGTPVYNYLDLGLDSLTRIITDSRQVSEQLAGASPEVSCALVMPRMPLYPYLPEPPNDWADFMGWYKLLARMGVGVDVWTLEDLPSLPASRYPSIVIPDCAYLSAEALDALRAAASSGARLISSGRFAHRDLTGRPRPGELTPAVSLALPQRPGAAFLGEAFRCPSPTDTPPRLRCLPGSPRPDAVAGLAARLREAGVPVLWEPSAGPANGLVLSRPGPLPSDPPTRLLMVLPGEGDPSPLTVAGQTVPLSPLGAIIPAP